MSDLFHEAARESSVRALFDSKVFAKQHAFLILSKRAARLERLWVDLCHTPGDPGWRPDNVWVGVTVEHATIADERIPYLLSTPAALRYLSLEPLLSRWLYKCPGPAAVGDHSFCNWHKLKWKPRKSDGLE